MTTIYGDRKSEVARALFNEFGYQVADKPNQADIVWLRRNYTQTLPNLSQGKIVNHIPGEKGFTNKGGLTAHLHQLDGIASPHNDAASSSRNDIAPPPRNDAASSPRDLIAGPTHNNRDYNSTAFYQESYLLSDTTEKSQLITRVSAADAASLLWVVKPSGSSRGRGVRILNSAELASAIIKTPADFESCIVQRHIDMPLLFNERKTEFRVYWLFLSIEPLQAYLYTDAVVRFCTEKFELADFANPLKHITNIFQQKQHARGPSPLNLKTTLASLLEANQAKSTGCSEEQIMQQISQGLAYVVKACYQSVLNNRTYNKYKERLSFFGFYGCDVMLDQQFKPWFLEIQKGPGLSVSDPYKAQVIKPALAGALDLVRQYHQGPGVEKIPEGYCQIV